MDQSSKHIIANFCRALAARVAVLEQKVGGAASEESTRSVSNPTASFELETRLREIEERINTLSRPSNTSDIEKRLRDIEFKLTQMSTIVPAPAPAPVLLGDDDIIINTVAPVTEQPKKRIIRKKANASS